MEYAEVTVIINEKKIAEIGKYPVGYIAHHIKCLAKTRKMDLVDDNIDENNGEHTLVYRAAYASNSTAPYTASFLATYIYFSPAKEYLDKLSIFDSHDNTHQDCISSLQEIEKQYGSIYD